MQGQTPLPEVEGLAPPRKPKTCAWCPNPATTELLVQKAVMGKGRHDKQVMKRKPIMAQACAPCARRIENRIEQP